MVASILPIVCRVFLPPKLVFTFLHPISEKLWQRLRLQNLPHVIKLVVGVIRCKFNKKLLLQQIISYGSLIDAMSDSGHHYLFKILPDIKCLSLLFSIINCNEISYI